MLAKKKITIFIFDHPNRKKNSTIKKKKNRGEEKSEIGNLRLNAADDLSRIESCHAAGCRPGGALLSINLIFSLSIIYLPEHRNFDSHEVLKDS